MEAPKKIILRTDSPCPCGSGKSIKRCHLAFDGRLRINKPRLHPPVPRTNFAHPKCYLNGTNDCSEEISREHYVSRAVLEQLGHGIKVTGAPWLAPGISLETTAESLTAKILCRRHNAALSPLDDVASSGGRGSLVAVQQIDACG